jgi:hypothetical protein
MPKSTYAQNQALSSLLYYAPVFVGLYLVSPGIDGGGTEVSTDGYTRQTCVFSPSVGGRCSNTNEIVFAPATADWGKIVSVGIFDARAAGNLLYYTQLNPQDFVNASDVVRFGVGQILALEH